MSVGVKPRVRDLLSLSPIVLVVWTALAFADDPRPVKVGIPDNPAVSGYSESNKPSGLAVDVINDIARAEGWRVTFVQELWPTLLRRLEAGEIDILTSISYSKKRAQRFDFTSETLFSNWGMVYRRSDVQINTVLDLEGKRLAVLEKGIHHLAILPLLRKFSVTYVPITVNSYGEALALVEKGEADAAVVSRIHGIWHGHKYDVVGTTILFNPVEVRFATTKGKGADLRAAIDSYLSAEKNTPGSSYHEHLSRWFNTPVRKEIPQWLIWCSRVALVVLGMTLAIIWLLRRQVKSRTTKLRESEERLLKAQQLAHVGDWEWNVLTGEQKWSDETFRILGITQGETPRQDLFENALHPDDRDDVLHRNGQTITEGSLYTREFRILRPDGIVRHIQEIREVVCDVDGKLVHCTGTIQDITERKQAEEQIKSSLKEKEVLLKEVHHRVKNNLQIISSLLDMSRRRAGNQEAMDLVAEAGAKIHTMALIHTQLYQSDRFDQIDMQRHIQNLIIYYSRLYGTKKDITPVINTSDVILSVTQAIPCALAMNELISNVFKHAFEEGKGGILEASMEHFSDGAISVKVKDDGIGIPEEVDIDNTDTLGLKLVRNLVLKQLKGKLRIERNNGTEVFIEFKVSKEEI